jgi:hypothetical protein
MQAKGDKAKSRKLFVRLTPEEYARLERLAEQEDRPVSSFVRMALREALAARGALPVVQPARPQNAPTSPRPPEPTHKRGRG